MPDIRLQVVLWGKRVFAIVRPIKEGVIVQL